jgi:hypothetical protein
MASRTLRRILSTGLRSASGALGAQIKAAQDLEEKRKQTNKENLDALLGQALYDERQARTEALRNPAPKIPKTGTMVPLGASGYLYNNLTGAVSQLPPDVLAALGAAEDRKKDKNITGIGDFTDIVASRKKETEATRKTAKQKIIDSFPDLFIDPEDGKPIEGLDSKTPEELVAYIKQQIPQNIEQGASQFWHPTTWGSKETVPNPQYDQMNQILGGINIPASYQAPVGQGAVALQDSIQAARTNPETAGALLGGVSQPSMQLDHVPSVDEFAAILKQQAAAGKAIDWEQITADFPDVVEELRRKVGQ